MDKINLIIDTDPGIDDAIALAIALNSEKLDIKLITTVSGNVGIENTTNNAKKILKFFNKENIPLAKGATEPLLEPIVLADDVHGKTGLKGYEFEKSNMRVLDIHAVEAMKNVLEKQKATILALGPLTNIALLLKMYPDIKKNIQKIVFMGGSLTRGNRGVMSEFNIHVDPHAARILTKSNIPLVMVGLDVGRECLISQDDANEIKNKNRAGQMIYSLLEAYRGASFYKGLTMYDSTALAYLLEPSIYEIKDAYIDIETQSNLTKGCSVVDLDNILNMPNNAQVVVKADGIKFRKWFIESIGDINE